MVDRSVVGTAREVRRVLILVLILNESVSIAKILWGYFSGSVGMISDGFHSMFDGVSNVMGLVGIWIASHPPDREHPYGHKKFETLFTVGIAALIFLTCLEVLRRVYGSIFQEGRPEVSATSFAIMGFTMAVNLFVIRYESRKGAELKSDFLIADSMHTRSDLIASTGVVAGLVLTRAGYPAADAVAGIVVAFFIARIGLKILKSAADVLVDTVRMDEDALCEVVLSVAGVRSCHGIRSRGALHHIHLDLHIQLAPDIPLSEAHAITHSVQDAVRRAFPDVVDIVVHTEPDGSA